MEILKLILAFIAVVAIIALVGNYLRIPNKTGNNHSNYTNLEQLKDSVVFVCDEAAYTLERITELTSSAWCILSGQDTSIDPEEAVEELEEIWSLAEETRRNLWSVDEMFDDY